MLLIQGVDVAPRKRDHRRFLAYERASIPPGPTPGYHPARLVVTYSYLPEGALSCAGSDPTLDGCADGMYEPGPAMFWGARADLEMAHPYVEPAKPGDYEPSWSIFRVGVTQFPLSPGIGFNGWVEAGWSEQDPLLASPGWQVPTCVYASWMDASGFFSTTRCIPKDKVDVSGDPTYRYEVSNYSIDPLVDEWHMIVNGIDLVANAAVPTNQPIMGYQSGASVVCGGEVNEFGSDIGRAACLNVEYLEQPNTGNLDWTPLTYHLTRVDPLWGFYVRDVVVPSSWQSGTEH